MVPSFEKEHHSLDYKIGEFHLLNVDFVLWMYKEQSIFSTDGKYPDLFEQFSILQDDDKSVSGYFFPSYPLKETLPVLQFLAGKICYAPTQFNRFFINLNDTFDNYEKKFSSKSKATLKRKMHKFSAFSGGEISWKIYRTPAELDEFCKWARQISLNTYQERLLDVGFPKTAIFENHLHELASRDEARGYLLFHDGKAVSYVFCECINGVVVYKFVGYDPKYRDYSVGTILQYLLLQSLFEEKKFRLFDFTEGEGQHKEFFSTGSVRCADIYLFKFTFRNCIWISLHFLLLSMSGLLVKCLNKSGLHQRVKKLIRFGRN